MARSSTACCARAHAAWHAASTPQHSATGAPPTTQSFKRWQRCSFPSSSRSVACNSVFEMVFIFFCFSHERESQNVQRSVVGDYYYGKRCSWCRRIRLRTTRRLPTRPTNTAWMVVACAQVNTYWSQSAHTTLKSDASKETKESVRRDFLVLLVTFFSASVDSAAALTLIQNPIGLQNKSWTGRQALPRARLQVPTTCDLRP